MASPTMTALVSLVAREVGHALAAAAIREIDKGAKRRAWVKVRTSDPEQIAALVALGFTQHGRAHKDGEVVLRHEADPDAPYNPEAWRVRAPEVTA